MNPSSSINLQVIWLVEIGLTKGVELTVYVYPRILFGESITISMIQTLPIEVIYMVLN